MDQTETTLEYAPYNKEHRDSPGRLKIFFGYAAGVGKTYAMLEAAHQAKKEGIDVVVGYVERHARPDTLALLESLEVLPCQEVDYRGIKLKEFDLDQALQRKPQLILVDELAHNNAQGCRHKKRYQDVEELLQAGINVYTTVNVQHLESLNDLVSSITGITVNERIPDHVFDRANQVELVDIEPDELVKRLQAGKVYRERQARQALQNFFTTENLAALREIAMRRTADQLNRTALQEGKGKSAKAGEHILICLSSAPSNAKVIRTAARMAEAFHSGFTALFVQTPETKELSGENVKRLRNNLRLAEQLGAQISTVYGTDPAVQIAEYARVSGVTKIVMGRINHKQNAITGKKSLADRLIELTDLDIYIIPDHQPLYKKPLGKMHLPKARFSWRDTGIMLATWLLSTAVGFAFYYAGFSESNIITVYILGVLLTAVWTGSHVYGAINSLFSVGAFNFFFTVPRYSFQAYDPSYPVTFLIMVQLALTILIFLIIVIPVGRYSLQLHLVSKGPLAGEQALPLQVAVHHDDGGGIIVQVADNDRHGFFLGQLTGPVPSVTGNQLIAALRVRAGNRRNQNTVLPHTVGGLHHGLVILDFEGMVLERMQLRQRDFPYFFQLGILAAFFGGKQVIVWSQFYFFRAAFQVLSPPWSDSCSPRPPCHWGRGQKCSCPRR